MPSKNKKKVKAKKVKAKKINNKNNDKNNDKNLQKNKESSMISYCKYLIENNIKKNLQPKSYIDIAHSFIENKIPYILSNSGILYQCPNIILDWIIKDIENNITTKLKNINWYVDYDDKKNEWYEICIFGKSKYQYENLISMIKTYNKDVNFFKKIVTFDEKSKNPYSKGDKDKLFVSILS